MKTKEILSLQQNSIQKTINLIKGKQNHIQYLQNEIAYKKNRKTTKDALHNKQDKSY